MHHHTATHADFAGEPGLRYVTSLVASLSSFSLSSRSFPGKWQSIRSRLDRLASALASANAIYGSTASSSSIGNLVLQELLQDIAATITETRVLATLCAEDASLPGGRLLMLSNLDLAISKLDHHIRSLGGLYASGILVLHEDLVIPPVPPAGAGREKTRLYVRDLCSRLVAGDSHVRTRALTALAEFLREDEAIVRVAVAEVPDMLSLLVRTLETRDVGVQVEAAEAVSVVAGFESHRRPLAMAGAIPAMLRVLETGGELGKERTARALKKLTENSDNAWVVSAHGGVTVLLNVVQGGFTLELLSSACGVLTNLAAVSEIRAFMVEEGIVPAFIKLLRSGEEPAQAHAIDVMLRIFPDDEAAREEALRKGALESLVGVLDPSRSSKTREAALQAIEALCNPATSGAVMTSGFLDRVLVLLQSGELSVQESALRSASRFLGMSEEARRAMGEAGYMPALVKLLDARSVEVREMAARVLSSIVTVQRNQRRFVEEDDANVGRILHVLTNRSEEKPLTTKFLLSALASLSDSNAGRKKIAASGYVRSLENMADGDARRIVRKVAGGRLRSFIQGFWGK